MITKPNGDWFYIWIWLVEKVVPDYWTNKKSKEHKSTATPEYFRRLQKKDFPKFATKLRESISQAWFLKQFSS